jgi:hypothetical protein
MDKQTSTYHRRMAILSNMLQDVDIKNWLLIIIVAYLSWNLAIAYNTGSLFSMLFLTGVFFLIFMLISFVLSFLFVFVVRLIEYFRRTK